MFIIIIIVSLPLLSLFLQDLKKSGYLSPNFKILKTTSPNSQLAHAMDVYQDLLKSNADSSILETQRKYIEALQELEQSKKQVELNNFSMVKSIETFNLCYELVMRNSLLRDMIYNNSEEEGMQILRRTANMNIDDFNNNRQSLKQLVCYVKSNKALPILN